jgi:hypothetical protein
MVRTDDGSAAQHARGLAAQGRAAMAAGVVKPLQHTPIVAHQENLLIAQLEGPKGSGAFEFAAAADIHPVAIPDSPQLSFVLLRVVVRLRRQAFGVFG